MASSSRPYVVFSDRAQSVVLVGSGVISIGLKKENCNCFKICSVFIPNHENNVIVVFWFGGVRVGCVPAHRQQHMAQEEQHLTNTISPKGMVCLEQ